MTTNEEMPAVPLDNVAHYIDTYRAVEKQIKELEQMRDGLRREIQNALGDNQSGTVNGRKAVRWTRYTQRRLSMTIVKKKFSPEDLADCYVDIQQNRFALLDGS